MCPGAVVGCVCTYRVLMKVEDLSKVDLCRSSRKD